MLTINDIVCYVPVYNDRDALERLLQKMQKLGIMVLVVDSRFRDFPQINGSDVSTDGTKELCMQYGVHYYAFGLSREEEKFNFGLETAYRLGYKVFIYCGADAYY